MANDTPAAQFKRALRVLTGATIIVYLVLAGFMVFVFISGSSADTKLENVVARNEAALVFLCSSVDVLRGLTEQSIVLLEDAQKQQFSVGRAVSIEIFKGYSEELSNQEECDAFLRRQIGGR